MEIEFAEVLLGMKCLLELGVDSKNLQVLVSLQLLSTVLLVDLLGLEEVEFAMKILKVLLEVRVLEVDCPSKILKALLEVGVLDVWVLQVRVLEAEFSMKFSKVL